ncbi:MAG: glycosyl hydrolase family protein [Chloroflexi bacterium]|nr:MAG: glycosyl hydrolase family protein [Chloroflexota bacterium]
MEGLSPGDFPPNPLEKEGYRLEFHDEFTGPRLDTTKWFPYYLPQWSARERARPSYILRDGCLVLQITADQQPWCPEFDGGVKCSSIQTGVFAGPLGSEFGQHRFSPACRVREAQENARLYTPRYGYFEMRAKGVRAPGNHVALWMIGYEDAPERSGEIAVFEIMGAHASAEAARVGHGVRRWGDPNLRDEFLEPFLPIDAAQWHVYALEWLPDHLEFSVDGVKISTVGQSPAYPMQFMLSIYEVPGDIESGEYPKQFWVDYFRAYRPLRDRPSGS